MTIQLRTAEVTVNELKALYPDIEGDELLFTVRDLLSCEMCEILALGEKDAFFKFLQDKAVAGGEVDLDCRHRVELIVRGTVNPKITHAFAVLLARDFREVLFRLSDKIMELAAQATGFENLAGVPRLH